MFELIVWKKKHWKSQIKILERLLMYSLNILILSVFIRVLPGKLISIEQPWLSTSLTAVGVLVSSDHIQKYKYL